MTLLGNSRRALGPRPTRARADRSSPRRRREVTRRTILREGAGKRPRPIAGGESRPEQVIQKTAREPEQMTEAENHRPRDTRRYRAGYYEYEKWPLRYVIVAAAKRDRDL